MRTPDRNPVLRLGHSNRALLGKFSRAPKGLATNATLSAPYGVAVDGMGDVIICDQGAAEHPGPFGVIEGGRKRAPGERVIIQYPIRLFGIEGGRNRRGYHSRAQAGRSDNIIEIPAVMRSSAKRRAR
jgi:hypothetical protein